LRGSIISPHFPEYRATGKRVIVKIP
jgi:hypothetical protein